MATGLRQGRGIRDRAIGESAGIRPYKIDLAYATAAAYLAAKSARGENSSSAQAGDFFYDSTNNCMAFYNGSEWQGVGPGSKYVNIVGSACAPIAHLNGGAGALATGADTTITNVNLGNGYPNMVVYNTGANTVNEVPEVTVDANCTDGLALPSTNTDNVGGTITFGGSLPNLLANAAACPTVFKVGTDGDFFMEVKIGIPDISDYDVLGIGFVEPAAAYVAAIDTPAEVVSSYDEKAIFALGDAAGDIDIVHSLAGVDDDNDVNVTAWADDAVKTLRIDVDSDGNCTYKIDGTAVADAPPGDFAADTFVTPCIIFAKGAAVADTPPIIEYIKWGHSHL